MRLVNPYRMWTGAFLPNWLMERQDISFAAKCTYARLCQFSDKDTGFAWPEIETLAESIGAGVRRTSDYVLELENAGLLTSRRRGQGRSNIYGFIEPEGVTADLHAMDQFPSLRKTADLDLRELATLELRKPAELELREPAVPLYKVRKESRKRISEDIPPSPPKGEKTEARPSSVDAVRDFMYEAGYCNDASEAEPFWNHFQSNGWKIGGKAPMKDWRAAVHNWMHRKGAKKV